MFLANVTHCSRVLRDSRSASSFPIHHFGDKMAKYNSMAPTGVKDVDQQKFVVALSAFFKKSGKIKPINNSDIIKLSTYNEMAPADPDWYYVRVASIARHLYMRAPCGVGAFTKVYGGRKNNGTRPSHFARGSSHVARHCLKSLEAIKLVEKDENGGRKLTGAGRRDMDRIAIQMLKK